MTKETGEPNIQVPSFPVPQTGLEGFTVPTSRTVFLDHVCRLLRHRIHSSLEMCTDLQRKYTGINNPQPLHPIHLQPLIHHTPFDPLFASHCRFPNRMPACDRVVLNPLLEISVGGSLLGIRRDLLEKDLGQGLGLGDFFRHTEHSESWLLGQ